MAESKYNPEDTGEIKNSNPQREEVFQSIDADLSKTPKVVSWVSSAPITSAEKKDSKSSSFSSKEIWEYTIGDLHGNTMLALWHALRSRIVKFKDEKSYQGLWDLYEEERKSPIDNKYAPLSDEQRTLLQDRCQKFKDILQNLEINTDNINVLLRFLGDTIGDRGANDLFTFWLMNHLEDLGVKSVTLVGNHELYLLSIYERAKKQLAQDKKEGKPSTLKKIMLSYFRNRDINFGYRYPSGQRLMAALQENLIDEDEFQKLMERYKLRLRVIDYSFIPAKSNKEKDQINIFMHARVGMEAIQFYAQGFGVTYRDETAAQLMQTIDEINVKFQEGLRDGHGFISNYNHHMLESSAEETYGTAGDSAAIYLHTLVTKRENQRQTESFIQEQSARIAAKNPFLYGCEARGLNPHLLEYFDSQVIPPMYNLHMIDVPQRKNYAVQFIGGHHAPTVQTVAMGAYSLDQRFGKDNGRHGGYVTQGNILVHEQEVNVELLNVLPYRKAALIAQARKAENYVARH